jgi:hypothetical protein
MSPEKLLGNQRSSPSSPIIKLRQKRPEGLPKLRRWQAPSCSFATKLTESEANHRS